MSAALGILVVLASLAVPLVLWLAISRETSNPTVVDRAEAERIAKERGGRGPSRSADASNRAAADDDHATPGWGDHRENGERDDRADRDEWSDRRT